MGDGPERASREYIQYVKERDEAREDARLAKEELTSLQSQLYDALKQIETLEKKAADSSKSSKKSDVKKSTKKGNVSSGSQNGATKGKPWSALISEIQPGSKCEIYHPPVPLVTNYACCSEYYAKLVENLPNLPMKQVLEAERKFMAADVDQSGAIDRQELDKVLTKTITMFTGTQLDEIFKEVDTDNSNSVDFYECLVILNKLVSRRKTNLPQTVQQNYSKTCSVQ